MMTFHSSPVDELTRGTVFQSVARLRIAESKVLLDSGKLHGAIYLAGYAVECQLKYAVCRRNGSTLLAARVCFVPGQRERPLYVHDWSLLLVAAQLRGSLERMETLFWKLHELWGPDLRYRTRPFKAHEASRLYREVVSLYQFFVELVP
jgi:hypothetical protein